MKILVPLDGSDFSRGTLAFLASRKTFLADHPALELINVQPSLPARAGALMSEEALAGYYEEESANAFEASGTVPESRAVRTALVGHPAEVIARETEDRGADLIVMGSHGMSGFSELLFGSVTMGVLARSHIPMLVLRNTTPPADKGVDVVFCVDGSDESRAAVKFALEHRSLFGETPNFILVHVSPTVVSSGADGAELAGKKEFEAAMDKVRPLFAAIGVVPEEVALTGTPGDAVATFAETRNAGFLVMGSHGYGRLKSLLLGSTALRIASQTKIPLLIVR